MIRTIVVRAQLKKEVFPDLEQFAQDLEGACNELELEGFEVISIVPVNQGHWSISGMGGYGYTTTQGVVVTARKAG